MRRLVDLQTQMNLSLSDCIRLVERLLDKPIYNKQEVCDLIGVSSEELDATSLSERSRHGQLQISVHCYVFVCSLDVR